MCRFAVYLGAEIRMGSLITEPVNSIINQSFHSQEREEPLNGDGFGIAWYPSPAPTEDREMPAVFKSTTPAWSNRNLREVARVTRTSCMLAHVRAATPGLPVIDLNCHPFVAGRLTFMHNGSLGGFSSLRRLLLAGLSDEAFGAIEGSTDSEHIFAVLQDQLRDAPADGDATERLARALETTIASVERLRRELTPERPSRLNLVACDGERAVITRYASEDEPSNTLYYSSGRHYVCEGGVCRMHDDDDAGSAVIVASEPLDNGDHWTRVEPAHIVTVAPDLHVTTRPIELA